MSFLCDTYHVGTSQQPKYSTNDGWTWTFCLDHIICTSNIIGIYILFFILFAPPILYFRKSIPESDLHPGMDFWE